MEENETMTGIWPTALKVGLCALMCLAVGAQPAAAAKEKTYYVGLSAAPGKDNLIGVATDGKEVVDAFLEVRECGFSTYVNFRTGEVEKSGDFLIDLEGLFISGDVKGDSVEGITNAARDADPLAMIPACATGDREWSGVEVKKRRYQKARNKS